MWVGGSRLGGRWNSGDGKREGECGAEGAGAGNGKIKKLIWRGAEGKGEGVNYFY